MIDNELVVEECLVAYSVVIPVFNSEKSLKELCERIKRVFTDIQETYEIIMVDDGSRDNSWDVMCDLHKQDSNIRIIQLMKNFGQQNALMCGFTHSNGKFIITMDDDMQNPPEEIPVLIGKMSEGYDVVIGVQKEKQDTLVKKMGSSFIGWLHTKIFDKPKHIRLSSFRIMTNVLVKEIAITKTPYPFFSGIMLSLTDRIGNVTVEHKKRKYGKSNYTFSKLIKLAFNLFINYTSLPLKMLTFFGMSVSLFSFCLGTYFVIKKIIVSSIVPGWTSLVVLLSFFNGLLLMILSIMGEYLARIIGEVSNRHQYIIRKKEL